MAGATALMVEWWPLHSARRGRHAVLLDSRRTRPAHVGARAL
jgi:hypothetical protein